MSAADIQRQREAEAAQQHRLRIQWLEEPNPQWSCGTPVSEGDRRMLLDLSRQALDGGPSG